MIDDDVFEVVKELITIGWIFKVEYKVKVKQKFKYDILNILDDIDHGK